MTMSPGGSAYDDKEAYYSSYLFGTRVAHNMIRRHRADPDKLKRALDEIRSNSLLGSTEYRRGFIEVLEAHLEPLTIEEITL